MERRERSMMALHADDEPGQHQETKTGTELYVPASQRSVGFDNITSSVVPLELQNIQDKLLAVGGAVGAHNVTSRPPLDLQK